MRLVEAWRFAGRCLVGALALAGLASAAVAAPNSTREEDDSIRRGAAVFRGRGRCHTCHGLDAHGTFWGPSLVDAGHLHLVRVEPDAIAALIAAGVPRPRRHPFPMPPRGGAPLTGAEIADLARYIASIDGTDTGNAKDRRTHEAQLGPP